MGYRGVDQPALLGLSGSFQGVGDPSNRQIPPLGEIRAASRTE
jgi:hypothetical protein